MLLLIEELSRRFENRSLERIQQNKDGGAAYPDAIARNGDGFSADFP
jgi:hypothetical protein